MLSWAAVDLDNNPTVLVVRKHLVEHLGPPAEVFEMAGSPLPGSPIAGLNVAQFAPGGPAAPTVVATCGASVFRMNDGRRVEALMILDRRPSDAALVAIRRLLASFALFSEANDAAVRFGDVVRAQEELEPVSSMAAILFVPPFTFLPSFHRVGLSTSDAVDLVWLLPVYATEADYALQYGPQALLTLFAAQQIDLTDLKREPSDCAMSPEAAANQAQRAIEAPPRRPPMPGGSPTPAAEGRPMTAVEEQTVAAPAQRRRPKPGPPAATAPPHPMKARATAERKRPVVRPSPAARRAREEGVRFDLAKDGLPGALKTSRPRAEARTPAPPTPTAPRKLTKAERVAALKKAAQEARQRALERRRTGGSSAPGSLSDGAQAPPRPALSPAGSPMTAEAARSSLATAPRSAASRRRGAPNRRGAPARRGGGPTTEGPDDDPRG